MRPPELAFFALTPDNAWMEASAAPRLVPARVSGVPSPRLLRLASDAHLVALIRQGRMTAFETAYDRHHRAILSFCRHMLGQPEEAEDAVQHTFLAAYNDLMNSEKPIHLRAWLFTIARNRCYSVLRARREQPAGELAEPATEGLAVQVQRRQDLRDLVVDMRRLPDDQRAALVLAELDALSHEEIGDVLGVPREKVKALVFQARESLIASRAARETDCTEIRQQLSSLRGAGLRRAHIRRHLRVCSGCRDFRKEIDRQRRRLAIVLPVAPTLALKDTVLAATVGGGAGLGAAGGGLIASSALKAVLIKGLIGAALAGIGTAGTIVAVRAFRLPIATRTGQAHQPIATGLQTNLPVARLVPASANWTGSSPAAIGVELGTGAVSGKTRALSLATTPHNAVTGGVPVDSLAVGTQTSASLRLRKSALASHPSGAVRLSGGSSSTIPVATAPATAKGSGQAQSGAQGVTSNTGSPVSATGTSTGQSGVGGGTGQNGYGGSPSRGAGTSGLSAGGDRGTGSAPSQSGSTSGRNSGSSSGSGSGGSGIGRGDGGGDGSSGTGGGSTSTSGAGASSPTGAGGSSSPGGSSAQGGSSSQGGAVAQGSSSQGGSSAPGGSVSPGGSGTQGGGSDPNSPGQNTSAGGGSQTGSTSDGESPAVGSTRGAGSLAGV